MDPALIHVLAVFAAAALIGLALAYLPFRAYLASANQGTPKRRWSALAGVAAFTAMGVGAYAAVGKPSLADAPYEARLKDFEAVLQRDQLAAPPEVVLEVMAQRAREEPNNPNHPFFAGRYYLLLGESDRAIQSFQRALRIAPNNPDMLLSVAEVLSELPSGPPPMVVAGLYANALQYMPADDPRRPSVEAALKVMSAQALSAPGAAAPPAKNGQ